MERKITIEEHVLYKEDYQMKMLKANSPEGFLHVGGRGVNGSSYYDYDVSGKVSMQAMYARAKLKAEDIRHFMEQLGNVLKEAERYLLDIHRSHYHLRLRHRRQSLLHALYLEQ